MEKKENTLDTTMYPFRKSLYLYYAFLRLVREHVHDILRWGIITSNYQLKYIQKSTVWICKKTSYRICTFDVRPSICVELQSFMKMVNQRKSFFTFVEIENEANSPNA